MLRALAAVGIAYAASVIYRSHADGVDYSQVIEGDAVRLDYSFRTWRAPSQYAGDVEAAEGRYGLPPGMLERVLWQESRYRPEIIDGRVSSPAGAQGIAQFMPRTAQEYGIDPLDPGQAIDAAGRYLSQLYRQFGDWEKALAAYNWGPGNVSKKGVSALPAETRAYVDGVMRDVGLS